MALHLINDTKQISLSIDIERAESYLSRLVGLLGRESLELGKSLWIKPCNNIHTMFMKFSIDVIFVDTKLIVKKVYLNIPPWRPLYYVWGAHSVFEMPAGSLTAKSVEKGDQLSVSS